MIRKINSLFCFLSLSLSGYAQQLPDFTRADSLRGTLNVLRSCYDVYFYDLHLRIDPKLKSISGYNTIYYTSTKDFNELQIDLFSNLTIDSITKENVKLNFKREGNATSVKLGKTEKKGDGGNFVIYYHGIPTEAVNPPWDGGFLWAKDKNDNPWVGVACEGIGASLWWPNKDHPTEEPDSMRMTFEVPKGLKAVSNGQLRKSVEGKDYSSYEWFVSYPINAYNVTVNIAKYETFSDSYTSKDGEKLNLDYYVLAYNKAKAQKHFAQVKDMLHCYEEMYDKYPFWKDGFAMVETAYWGMEHQSAVSYGNKYVNNDFGFDFIIIHESAHEYWGNSITAQDHGELWIHESFGTYTEALFLECWKDYRTAIRYLMNQKKNIKNELAILGPLGVNFDNWPDADMYYKGTWMLHSIRNTIENDTLWKSIVKEVYNQFKMSIVSTGEIVSFMDSKTDYNLKPIFDQFLRQAAPPVLEYKLTKTGNYTVVEYRWQAEVKDFNMPMKIKAKGKKWEKVSPTASWQSIKMEGAPSQVKFAEDLFYFVKKEVR